MSIKYMVLRVLCDTIPPLFSSSLYVDFTLTLYYLFPCIPPDLCQSVSKSENYFLLPLS